LIPRPTPPDETVIAREEHADIRQALKSLSAADRDLLWMRDIEGLGYKDIGGRLGAATGTIRVRCHRARQRLGTAYEEINHDTR
jgi:RNA polymerase sigma-70 factor (ECF subfamily)